MSSKSRKRERLYCGHCKQLVGKSTFYRHYEQYYNVNEQKWNGEESFATSSDSEGTLKFEQIAYSM